MKNTFSTRRFFLTVAVVLLFCRFSDVFADESRRFTVCSPDESIRAELTFTDAPVLRVLRGDVEVVAPSRIALTVEPAFDGGLTHVDSATSERNEVWTPTRNATGGARRFARNESSNLSTRST